MRGVARTATAPGSQATPRYPPHSNPAARREGSRVNCRMWEDFPGGTQGCLASRRRCPRTHPPIEMSAIPVTGSRALRSAAAPGVYGSLKSRAKGKFFLLKGRTFLWLEVRELLLLSLECNLSIPKVSYSQEDSLIWHRSCVMEKGVVRAGAPRSMPRNRGIPDLEGLTARSSWEKTPGLPWQWAPAGCRHLFRITRDTSADSIPFSETH